MADRIGGVALVVAACGLLAAPVSAAAVKAPGGGRPPTIAVGDTVQGELEPGDAGLGDGSRYDCYLISGRPGQLVTISLRSLDFDAYLLAGPGRPDECDTFPTPFQDDNSGVGPAGSDAQLTLNLDENGGILVLANSWDPDVFGVYALVVEPGGPSVLALAP